LISLIGGAPALQGCGTEAAAALRQRRRRLL